MKTMILLFVVAFSLLVSPTSRAQTCIDSYWELEDLGELQGDRSPVPHLPFTDPWVVRCGIGTVNGINSHGDVVSTHDTPSGPVAAVNDGSLPVAASGPSIACAISDDRWVSGSHDGNAALWYLAGSSYSLYPFSLLPSGALPNASLHIGAMPTVQWIRQPGNVLEMLSGGVYETTGGYHAQVGSLFPDLSAVPTPDGEPWSYGFDPVLNDVRRLPNDQIVAAGLLHAYAKSTAVPVPLYLRFDPSTQSGIFEPVATSRSGAIHAINDRGIAVGCYKGLPFDNPYSGFFYFPQDITADRFLQIPTSERSLSIVGHDPANPDLEAETCLFALNRHNVAGGMVKSPLHPTAYGILHSLYAFDAPRPLSRHFPYEEEGDLSALPPHASEANAEWPYFLWELDAVRGITDDGVIAAEARLVDDMGNVESRHAVRLTPVLRLASISLVNASPHPDPSQPPVLRYSTGAIRVTFDRPVPPSCRTLSRLYLRSFARQEIPLWTLHSNLTRLNPGSTVVAIPVRDLLGVTSQPSNPALTHAGVELAAHQLHAPAFFFASDYELECAGGRDEDLDGLTDCADPDCDRRPCEAIPGDPSSGICENQQCKRVEICHGGIDEDGDGLIDCADPDCDGMSCGKGCVCRHPNRAEENCYDGEDNDGDGFADCDDSDCFQNYCDPGFGAICDFNTTCLEFPCCVEIVCSDGNDNDGDGLVDGNDPDCEGKECGWPGSAWIGGKCIELDCGDGVDNDNNNRTDCADDACDGQPCGMGAICQDRRCVEVVCNDHIDNNALNGADCADKDCLGQVCHLDGSACISADPPTCAEIDCMDGIDNDGDDRIDCADVLDCQGKDCPEGYCSDGQCVNCEKCDTPECEGRPCRVVGDLVHRCMRGQCLPERP